ncbi:MAG: purine-binding chemotaxis protein CheW [Gammaproteobacteria bacterium]|nr:purine-binding chemotaxis protein CheW [Gammaproteobacteria bacterium]
MKKLLPPIDLLLELEVRSKKNARGLPQQAVQTSVWSGIAFRVGGINIVAPLNHVNEILHYPNLTLVPGTLAWVKGLANIRGTLLPVVDLHVFLNLPPIRINPQSRILVIDQGELVVGLLVDEVLGLRHFEPEQRVTRIKKLDPAIKPYIHGAFQHDGQIWHLFDMMALTQDPLFYKVAV